MKLKIKKPKVVVAMSGGVDSSVVAAILKKQGYEVVGVFMQFWFPSGETYGENRCCSLESWHEAMEVARILDIPIHKVNFGKEFKKKIVDEFLNDYKKGQTPNPCVACNKFIKFDLLLKYAKTVFGAEYLATGHYISIKNYELRIKNKKQKVFSLNRPKDKQKDQTYFLYNLKQVQLKHLLFPLGEYNKTEIRSLAKKLKLPIHDKPDSQEVCFVGASHNEFLKKYLRPKAGEIRDEKGKVLGTQQGLPFYTLGQRSGLGLSGGPWYVSNINNKKNILIVTRDEKKSKIFGQELIADKISWISSQPKLPLTCQAQIRYHAQPAKCKIEKYKNKIKVKFVSPQRAIMPGQSVVFYNGDELLGGGVIS